MSRYFGLTIDPLHIGAGGYRLGRVDNTIIRDPGTGLPKVPGSSISGVCRNHAMYGLEGEDRDKAVACATNPDDKIRNNCGECPICAAFGYANGVKKKSRIGLVKFFDGQIVAFPVSTLAGPAWITTPAIMAAIGGKSPAVGSEEVVVNFPLPGRGNAAQGTGHGGGPRLNLGWLYLPARTVTTGEFAFPEDVMGSGQMKLVGNRLVLAPDWLFPEIVNSNLEVRTSVSIDFATGAARDGLLFTYEAIPRATLLAFDVVVDEHRCQDSSDRNSVEGIVRSGLKLFESLGLGGMNTRGFGRLQVVGL